MPSVVRNLIAAVVGLGALSLVALLLFDTAWWGILVGFTLAVAWIAIFSRAVSVGVPLVPKALRSDTARIDAGLAKFAPPMWVLLVVIWFAAGWFITNGGG